MDTPLVELKKIHQSFVLDSGAKLKVLQDVNLTFNANEILVLLGPSGSGKSTCLRIMAGLIKPTQGKVTVRGERLHGVNREMGMVFQSFALLPWLTVSENVALGISPLNLPYLEIEERVERAIQQVGLAGFGTAYPKELSGGMKQRVGIARALVMERPMLCLDEPFSALDVLTAETLRREVVSLWLGKKTAVESVLMVTHNITEAISMGTRIMVMGTNPGQIRYTIKNDLPYPRDEKTSAFKSMVESVHDVLTEAIIPETPDWVPPALADSTVEALPAVSPEEILAFMDHVAREGGRADVYALSQKMLKDSVNILLITKAAELFDFVETPRNQVVLTNTGRAALKADSEARKALFQKQLRQLKLVQNFADRVGGSRTISYDEAQVAVQEWLPNENPQQILDTLIQWGRYAELLAYDSDTGIIELMPL